MQKPRWHGALYSTLALAVIFLFCTWSLLRWLDVPSVTEILKYPWRGDDVLFTAASIKAFLHGDWGLFGLVQTPFLGAPFGFNLGDFPSGYQLQFVVIKLISFFTTDAFVAFNVFFLLSFYFCAVSFFFCIRQIGSSRLWAIPLSVAFAVLPFHFARYHHAFFADYFTLAPICVIAFFLALGVLPIRVMVDGRRLGVQVKSWPQICLIAALVIANGLSGIYFAFFFCLILAFALLIGGFRRNMASRATWFALLVMLTIGTAAVDHVASIRYKRITPENPMIGVRGIDDSEHAGFRLATFVLPTNSYFIQPLRARVQTYLDILPPIEGREEYGGALAVFGLVCSIGALLSTAGSRQLRILGQFNIAAILYSMVGGFNIVFGLFVLSSFRSMNRLSLIIACFSIFALVFTFRRWLKRLPILMSVLLAAGLTVFVVYDQTPSAGPVLSREEMKSYDVGQRFFSSLDQICGKGAAILQLPYTLFPEAPPVGTMHEYDHFRAYLANENLHWSFGAMKGREGDQKIAMLSTQLFDLKHLQEVGYSGVELDMNGFAGHSEEVLNIMKQKLGTTPVTSDDLRWFFYPLPASACRVN